MNGGVCALRGQHARLGVHVSLSACASGHPVASGAGPARDCSRTRSGVGSFKEQLKAKTIEHMSAPRRYVLLLT